MRKALIVLEPPFLRLIKDGVASVVKQGNYSIQCLCVNYLDNAHSYISKIRYKYNLLNCKDEYYRQLCGRFCELAQDCDEVLFIDACAWEYLLTDDMWRFLDDRHIKCKVYFVDTMKNMVDFQWELLHRFSKIYSFEYNDVQFASEKYGLEVEYVPLGTCYDIFAPSSAKKEVYDISFVGMTSPLRVEILEAIAQYAQDKHRSMNVVGPFWHDNNCLQEAISAFKFRIKHPLLAKCVHNTFLPPPQVAELYRNSRICLNINIAAHSSVNVREFDIMSVGGGALVTLEQSTQGLPAGFREGAIMCRNKEQMLEAIDYYLSHEEERLEVVRKGREYVRGRLTFANTLDRILRD